MVWTGVFRRHRLTVSLHMLPLVPFSCSAGHHCRASCTSHSWRDGDCRIRRTQGCIVMCTHLGFGVFHSWGEKLVVRHASLRSGHLSTRLVHSLGRIEDVAQGIESIERLCPVWHGIRQVAGLNARLPSTYTHTLTTAERRSICLYTALTHVPPRSRGARRIHQSGSRRIG
jgi:hypothetical protein